MNLTDLTKHISEMTEGTSEGIARQKYGSYADRNPSLGKMKTCPACHQRRREFALEPCCNPSHVAVISEEASIKKAARHFLKKHHSNKTRHQLHDLGIALKDKILVEADPEKKIEEVRDQSFRDTTQLLAEGLPGFWTPPNDIPESHIPSFAEKVLLMERKAKARQKRKQQQDARRINFGLKRGKNG